MKSISFFLILFFLNPALLSATKVDSLLTLLEEVEKKEILTDIYKINYLLGKEYSSGQEEKYEKATFHYAKAYKVAIATNNKMEQVDCLYGIAYTHQRRNNYQEALNFFQQGIDLAEKFPDDIESAKMARVYTQRSSIYQVLGDYKKAFDNQMQSLLICEKNDDFDGIANAQYNLGTIFFYQNQFERAREHYEKAKVICDQLKQERLIYSCLAALGSVNEKLGESELSLEYNIKSLELASKLNYKTGIGYAKGNIAANYLSVNNFAKAEEYCKDAISIKLDLEDRNGAIGSKIDLSRVYLQWNKPKEAIIVLDEALELANIVESKSRQSDIYKYLSVVYEELNNNSKALEYTKRYVALKDSLLNEKTLEEMGTSKQRYQLEKKEHDIEMLQKENELLEQRELNQSLQKYVFGLFTIAFLLFIWWYRAKLRYQNNVNRILEEKNELLNSMNDEIEIKNKQLEHSNEDLKQFAYVASHDLKEPLRMINSYTNLLQRRYMASFDESGKEFMNYITDAVGRMETLLDDLLDFSRAGTQPTPTNFTSTQDVMVMVEANLRHRLELLNATLVIKNDNLPSVKAHRTQMIQLLQNLVSNGMKFKGEKDPIVEVDCLKKDNKYIFSVKDNGIGISKENLEKVFEMFRRLHTREEYEGTGIGLATCKRIVTTWGGDIWVESEEGNGCTFFFSVPSTYAMMPEAKKLEAVSA
ncbi:MAG: tetratricopeptide repeat protein [Saprospiraceae bacterium]